MSANIRKLDENTANQIAAGEVIERPAAVIKELVENAIDAAAREIIIRYQDGGKTLIEVRDDGTGIRAEELPLAIERHATSKLPDTDLLAIESYGFRGEALPSIGAVSRLEIASKHQDTEASSLRVEGGKISPPAPAALNQGTRVRVRDLFYATPARLKFQSTDRAEAIAILETVKRLAMTRPAIAFKLIEIKPEKERLVLDLPALRPHDYARRVEAVLGKNALQDTITLDVEHQHIQLKGFLGLPTAAKGSSTAQYFFVNDRPVKDKLFYGAVKGAYSDLLPSGRFPFVVLFMTIPTREIDVNVHPAKAEIRFKEAPAVRSFVLNAIRHSFLNEGLRADAALSQNFAQSFNTPENNPTQTNHNGRYQGNYGTHRPSASLLQKGLEAQFVGLAEAPRAYEPQPIEEDNITDHPLGVARAQYHDNYIIAETKDGLIIVDQHAAHERLVYEKLKSQYDTHRLASQALLVPEILSLGAAEREALLAHADELKTLGLEVESFGAQEIAVQAVPALLSHASPAKLVADVIDALDEDPKMALEARINHLLATMACHGSVRSGRKLRMDEMNALLREMEATPNSGTCNHGRPTFIKMDLKTLEGRFGR